MKQPPVTVRDLLSSGVLPGTRVVAGDAGLDRLVAEIVASEINTGVPAADTLTIAEVAGPGSIRESLHNIDTMLRRAADAGAAALILCQLPAEALPLSPVRIANRYRVPLVAAPTHHSIDLAYRLKLALHHADVHAADKLCTLVDRIPRNASLGTVVSVLADSLDATAAALTPQGIVMAGQRPAVKLDIDWHRPVPVAEVTGTGAYAARPLLNPDGNLAFWILAHHPLGGVAWRDLAARVLHLAEAFAAKWWASEKVTAEREARYRSRLLGEVLAQGPELPRRTAELADRIGWNITGWNTGVHFLRLSDETQDTASASALDQALLAAGLTLGPVIEQPDGWATWVSAGRPGQDTTTLTEAVTYALRTYTAQPGTIPVAAGIGTSASGPAGLASSLNAARRAALAAAVGGTAGSVQHVDLLGTDELLRMASTSLADSGLLAPLLASPHGATLLKTVEAFLDFGTLRAAQRLHLSRNTVTTHINRASRVLGVNLGDPDQRLLVHLACRAHRAPGEQS